MKNRVFLGGTCNNSTWRDFIIPSLKIDYFNPVVKDWTPDCQENERVEKAEKCNIHFYCITKEMTGVFSIAEVIESTLMSKKIAILHVIPDGFDSHMLKSLWAVVEMAKLNGGIAYVDGNLFRSVDVLNNCFKE